MTRENISVVISLVVGACFALWPLFVEGSRHEAFPHLEIWLLLAVVATMLITLILPGHERLLAVCVALPVLPVLLYGMVKNSDAVGIAAIVGTVAMFWGIFLFACCVGGVAGARLRRLVGWGE